MINEQITNNIKKIINKTPFIKQEERKNILGYKDKNKIDYKDKNKSFNSTNDISDSNASKLLITFLGGIREIGRNCTAYEYKNKIYIIDCGTIFRSSSKLGVNLALPNIEYLKKNSHKIQSILVTHGHEDHVGGIKFLLQTINKSVPIYMGKFPAEIMKKNFSETKDQILLSAIPMIRCIKNNFTYFADQDLKFRFVSVTHSTPDSYFIFVNTKTDTVLHTGDWKFDLLPIATKTDFFHITHAATIQGVDLVITDSTRCEHNGFSDSEHDVINKFNEVFEQNKNKRIFISMFGSNADRMIKLVKIAQQYNRNIFLSGWSLIKCVSAAMKIGLIKGKNLFLNVESIAKFKPEETIIFCTGAQGEVEAALSKLTRGEKKHISMDKNDLVIFSANIIPGNEKNTMNLIELLLEQEVTVYHPSLSTEYSKFHVSGHGMKKDILMMLNLVNPKNFIPVHGELHHLLANIKTATEFGIEKENIFLPRNNDSFSLLNGKVEKIGNMAFQEQLIDFFGNDIKQSTVEDREIIAQNGFLFLTMCSNKEKILLEEFTFYFTSKIFVDIKDKFKISVENLLLSFVPSIGNEHIKEAIKTELQKFIKGLNCKNLPLIVINRKSN